MAKKRSNEITGRYRIKSMELWIQDFVDAEVPGYLNFAKNGSGDFQFGYICCDIDWQKADLIGEPVVELNFQGSDEMEPTSGHGWAVLEDCTLTGEITIFQGDESGFAAKKHKA